MNHQLHQGDCPTWGRSTYHAEPVGDFAKEMGVQHVSHEIHAFFSMVLYQSKHLQGGGPLDLQAGGKIQITLVCDLNL